MWSNAYCKQDRPALRARNAAQVPDRSSCGLELRRESSKFTDLFLSLAASAKTREQGNVLLGLGEDCKSNGKFFWNILTIVWCLLRIFSVSEFT